jgi:hypothetical protein
MNAQTISRFCSFCLPARALDIAKPNRRTSARQKWFNSIYLAGSPRGETCLSERRILLQRPASVLRGGRRQYSASAKHDSNSVVHNLLACEGR